MNASMAATEEPTLVFERLNKALKSHAARSAGCIHVHDTQLAEAPKDLLEGATGLTAVQPIRRTDGKLSFIAYWTSSDDATLSGPALLSRLGASGPSLSGIAGEPITRPPPGLWGKVKDKAVPLLLTTVAVIAALEGLSNRYEALIAAPQFTVRFDAPTYNIDEGDAVAASVTVENALTGVELSAINVAPKMSAGPHGRPGGSIEMLKLEDASLPATKSRTYYLSIQNLGSGEHVVSADVTAKAGRFRDSRLVPATARVIVWPSEAEASIVQKQTRQNRADFLVTLRVGKLPAPSIVACDLRFKGKLAVPNNYWRSLGRVPETRWVPGPEANLLRVTWPALPGRSTHHAELSLIGEDSTDWKKVVADSVPMCSIS